MVASVLELYGLLAGLLHPVVAQRMTLEELLETLWLRQPINLAEYTWGEVFPSSNGERRCTLTPKFSLSGFGAPIVMFTFVCRLFL